MHLLGILALFSFMSIFAVRFLPHLSGIQDIQIYQRIAEDVSHADSEYPPLATTLFVVTRLLPLEFAHGWFALVFALLLITIVLIAVWFGTREAFLCAVALAITPFLLHNELVFGRYDILLSLLLLLAWKCHAERQFRRSGALIALAFSLKLIPLLLFPLLLITTPKGMRRRWITGIAIGLALGTLFPMFLLGPSAFFSNLQYLLRYHGERAIQWESAWSGVHLLISAILQKKDPLEYIALSAQNMAFSRASLALAASLVIISTTLIGWIAWKRRSSKHVFERAFPATVLLVLFFSPILSPQYIVWITPLVIAWLLSQWINCSIHVRHVAIFACGILALTLGTQWVFPHHYGELLDQASVLTVVVLNVRNASLLFLAIAFFAPLLPFHLPSRRRWSLRRRGVALCIGTTVTVLLLGSLALAYRALQPTFGPITIHFPDGTTQSGDVPFIIDSRTSPVIVDADVTLSRFHPRSLRIKPDDCIEQFSINGMSVDESIARFCDYGSGRPLPLAPYLHSGTNHLQFVLSDSGGKVGVNLSVHRADPLFVLLDILLVFTLGSYGLLLLLLFVRREKRWLFVIFFFGVVLRILYFFATPYSERGHDTDAHIDYIQYVAEHLRIPRAQDGWEYHQSPLYYSLTALQMNAERRLGREEKNIIEDIAFVSLLLSIVTLGIGIYLLSQMWPGALKRAGMHAAAMLFATSPSLIFHASRITNDVLLQLFAILLLLFLLRWWRRGDVRDWYATCLLFALGFLTKFSMVVFAPAVALSFFLRHPRRWRSLLLHGSLSLFLILAVAAWLPILRLAIEEKTHRILSIGNEGMDTGLLLENTPANFLTFNPIQVVAVPFNDTWNDAARRRYFWEYLFRSAFFGQFNFPDAYKQHARTILIGATLAFPIALFGLLASLVRTPLRHLPLWASLMGLLSGVFLYRFFFPCSCNQDFRFIVVAILPIAFFAAYGVQLLRRSVRPFAVFLIHGVSFASALFILRLAFFPL